MTQLIGLLLVANSLAFTTWWVATGQPGRGYAVALCLMSVFAGVFLMIRDRALEITVKEIGNIKAVAEQANVDARQIAAIRDQVSGQRATLDLVAEQARELHQ